MDYEQLKKAYEAVELLKVLNLPVSEEQMTAIADLEKKYLRETVIPYVKKELEPFLALLSYTKKIKVNYSPEEGLDISIDEESVAADYPSSNASLDGKNRVRYSIDGGSPLNKRRFVLEVVRKYVESYPGITFDEFERRFPSSLSNSPLNGVARTYNPVIKRCKTQPDLKKRFLLESGELIVLSDGTIVTIYNQWGSAFGKFLHLAKQLHDVKCFE